MEEGKHLHEGNIKNTRLASMWLTNELSNLNPGILLSLHTTPTSSECLQSVTPQPLEEQAARVTSLPVQWTLSNQMGPEGGKERNQVLCQNRFVCLGAPMLDIGREFRSNFGSCV